MAPPRPTTDGSYGKNVRNWGENVERSPEDCVLTPPRRAVSNAGGFESRIQSTLIKAPPPDNTEKRRRLNPSRSLILHLVFCFGKRRHRIPNPRDEETRNPPFKGERPFVSVSCLWEEIQKSEYRLRQGDHHTGARFS